MVFVTLSDSNDQDKEDADKDATLHETAMRTSCALSNDFGPSPWRELRGDGTESLIETVFLCA